MTSEEGSALTEEEYARVLHWLTRLCGRCESCRGMEWEMDRELYALPGFRSEEVLPMVLVVCKTCRYSRLFHAMATGLVWRGDHDDSPLKCLVRCYRRHPAYFHVS